MPIPIYEKFLLTVPEASTYFNIGRDKLYSMLKEEGCTFVLHNGKNILVKKKVLEKYLESKQYI